MWARFTRRIFGHRSGSVEHWASLIHLSTVFPETVSPFRAARVGEARNDAISAQTGTVVQHSGKERRATRLDGFLDIAGFRAIEANDDVG
jgi:hypothetical protein